CCTTRPICARSRRDAATTPCASTITRRYPRTSPSSWSRRRKRSARQPRLAGRRVRPGRLDETRPRRGDVRLNLRAQFVHRSKALYGPYARYELEAQLAAVKIAGVVQQVNLDQRLVLAKGGTTADVCHRRMGTAFVDGVPRVDSIGGQNAPYGGN